MKRIVSLAYYWTYLNIIIFLICIFIGLIDVELQYPKEWSKLTRFTLFSYAIFFSILPLVSLYFRDKFDFIRMADGKSNFSQGVWIGMSLIVNATTAMILFLGVSEFIEFHSW